MRREDNTRNSIRGLRALYQWVFRSFFPLDISQWAGASVILTDWAVVRHLRTASATNPTLVAVSTKCDGLMLLRS